MNEPVIKFLESVKALCPKVTVAELSYLERGLSLSEFGAKHFYMHANTIQREIGFVHQGLLRSFYIDKKGNEITVNFVREGYYATDYTAFITKTPSKYYFQCIEPTLLVNLSYDHIQDGYDQYPNLERYGRLVAEAVLKVQQTRIERFLFENSEARYLGFVAENPNLFNRVSLSHLSSYLGIERQTLTRIRQKLARN